MVLGTDAVKLNTEWSLSYNGSVAVEPQYVWCFADFER